MLDVVRLRFSVSAILSSTFILFSNIQSNMTLTVFAYVCMLLFQSATLLSGQEQPEPKSSNSEESSSSDEDEEEEEEDKRLDLSSTTK